MMEPRNNFFEKKAFKDVIKECIVNIKVHCNFKSTNILLNNELHLHIFYFSLTNLGLFSSLYKICNLKLAFLNEFHMHSQYNNQKTCKQCLIFP